MRVTSGCEKYDQIILFGDFDWNYANWPKHKPIMVYNNNPDLEALSQDQRSWNYFALDTCEDISWFWTEEWQIGERRASLDIKRGKFTKSKTVEELISHLNDLKKK